VKLLDIYWTQLSEKYAYSTHVYFHVITNEYSMYTQYTFYVQQLLRGRKALKKPSANGSFDIKCHYNGYHITAYILFADLGVFFVGTELPNQDLFVCKSDIV